MTNSSKAVHHRIMITFPNIVKWKNYEQIITNLVDFFEGEKIRINDTWRTSRGHFSLIANAEGRKVLKILKAVNVRLIFDNDAPKRGALGNYFKCYRKNADAVTFFKELLAEAKTNQN